MRKPKCILLKLIHTPPDVRIRIVDCKCEECPSFCIVKRADTLLGWEVVRNYADKEEAVDYLLSLFAKVILYK